MKLSFFFISLLLILSIFSLVKYKFIVILLLMENLKMLLLIFCYLKKSKMGKIIFLVFIVVATVEIVLSLVVVTHIWKADSIYF